MDSKVKRFIGTFLDLSRPRNMVMAFLGVFTGAILYNPLELMWTPIFFASISAALILAAGNSLNDYFDHEIDKINKPERPIPSGRITRSDVLMLSIFLMLSGLGLAKAINDTTLLIALLNSIMLIIYGKYSKRMLLLSNISVSYLVASLFIYGAASSLQEGKPIFQEILLVLAASSFLLTMSREIVKDVEDKPGDEQMYAYTLPIKFGEKIALRFALIFTFLGIAVSLVPMFTGPPNFNLIIYIPIILIANILFLLSYTMYSSIQQKLLVGGMAISLIGFLLSAITI